MKGILYLVDPAGTFFEGVVEIPSDSETHERRLKRENAKTSIKVNLSSDSPSQLKCSVGEKKSKILFEFKDLPAAEEVSRATTGRNPWTGRFTAWTSSFEKP